MKGTYSTVYRVVQSSLYWTFVKATETSHDPGVCE